MRCSQGNPKQRKGGAVLALAAALLAGAIIASPMAATPGGPDTAAPSLALSPSVVMLKGAPGQSATQRLTLTNRTSQEFTFELVAQDVVARDTQRVFVPAGETPGSIAATAVFSEKFVRVPAGQAASVTVTVTVPAETRVRAIVALFRGTQQISAGGALTMTASLGTLMTFNLSDNFRVHPEPVAISAQTATKNVGFSQWLRNIGTEPGLITGMAAVVNEAGALVGKTQFPVQRLLPGQRLEFRADYPAELAVGRYRVFVSFDIAGKVLTMEKEFAVP